MRPNWPNSSQTNPFRWPSRCRGGHRWRSAFVAGLRCGSASADRHSHTQCWRPGARGRRSQGRGQKTRGADGGFAGLTRKRASADAAGCGSSAGSAGLRRPWPCSVYDDAPIVVKSRQEESGKRLGGIPKARHPDVDSLLILSTVKFEGSEGRVVPVWSMRLLERGPSYGSAVDGDPGGQGPAADFSAIASQQPCLA